MGECSNINWLNYLKQVFLWLLVVQLMKAIMVLLLVIQTPQLSWLAGAVLHPLAATPQLKLVIVMILTPGIMNSLQFWLQDNIFVAAAKSAAEKEESRKMLARLEREAKEAKENAE